MSEFTPEQIAAADAARIEQKEQAVKEMEAINNRLLDVLAVQPEGFTQGQGVGVQVTVDGEDLGQLLGLTAFLLQALQEGAAEEGEHLDRGFIAAAALCLGRVTVVHAEAVSAAE